jgi:hypothetical protein
LALENTGQDYKFTWKYREWRRETRNNRDKKLAPVELVLVESSLFSIQKPGRKYEKITLVEKKSISDFEPEKSLHI